MRCGFTIFTGIAALTWTDSTRASPIGLRDDDLPATSSMGEAPTDAPTAAPPASLSEAAAATAADLQHLLHTSEEQPRYGSSYRSSYNSYYQEAAAVSLGIWVGICAVWLCCNVGVCMVIGKQNQQLLSEGTQPELGVVSLIVAGVGCCCFGCWGALAALFQPIDRPPMVIVQSQPAPVLLVAGGPPAAGAPPAGGNKAGSKFCTSCGTALSGKFCQSCGAKAE